MRYSNIINSLAFIVLTCSSLKSAAQPELVQQKNVVNNKYQHGYEDLKNFQLGEVKFDNLDFKGSVQTLMEKYRAVCIETLEQPLDIAMNITSKLDTKITYTAQGDFILILTRLCAIYGMEIKIHKKGFTFIRSPELKKLSTRVLISTRVLRVPPNMNILCPKAETKKRFNLQSYQFINPTALKIKGKAYDVDRCVKFINSYIQFRPNQIVTGIKMISLSFGNASPKLQAMLDQGELNLKPEDLQQLVRALASNKGVNISTWPSMMSKDKENTSIEIIKEFGKTPPGPKLVEPAPWVGYKLDINSAMLGLSFKSDLIYDYHHVDGMLPNYLNKFPAIEGKERIEEFNTVAKLIIKDGMARVLKVKGPKKFNNYIIITQDLIDSTGRRIKNK